MGFLSGPLKKRLTPLALAAFLALGFAHECRAEDRVVTLAEAYELALLTHEDVLVAEEGVQQARSNLGVATSGLLPTVTAEGTYTRYTEEKQAGGFLVQPESESAVQVTLTQPLFAGWRKWNERKRAVVEAESSRVSLDNVREEIVLGTSDAYYGVLKARKDVEINEAALKRARERLRVAKARFRVGEVTKADVLRAEAEAAGAEADLTRSRGALTDAFNVLKRFIGADGEIDVAEPGLDTEVAGDLDSLLATAYSRRYDYRSTVLDEEAAAEGVDVARGYYLPTLDLVGSYTYRERDPSTSFFVKEVTSGSLVLTYPLFEGLLRRNQVAEARSLEREAELRRLALRKDIEVEVRSAHNNVTTLEAVLESLEKQVAFAEEDYKMVFEQFKVGVATTVDVIDSDANLVEAQSSLASARYDLELARLTLKRTVGLLLEEALPGG